MIAPRARMLVGATVLGAVVLACDGPSALAHVALSFGPLLAMVLLAWDGRYRGEACVLALHRRAAGTRPTGPRRASVAIVSARPRAFLAPPSRHRGAPRAVRGPPLLVAVTIA